MRTLASFAALILLPAPLFALEISFSGPPPDALKSREVKMGPGAEPWEPVVFEFPDADTALVRAARDEEAPSAQLPFYRFEWLDKEKKGAKFFPMTPPEEIERVRKLNDASIATAGGAATENSIAMAYVNKGAVVRTCMANDKAVPEALTMYITVTPGQPKATAVILPEGAVAECVLNATDRGTYPALKAPFTARFRLGLAR
jgi:hypothetical protein